MDTRVVNVGRVHDLLNKFISNEFEEGLYALTEIEPLCLDTYDGYGLQLADPYYGGDVYDKDGSLVATAGDLGRIIFKEPRYNVNIQRFIRDYVLWTVMQRCPDNDLYFTCPLTSMPVPLIDTEMLNYQYFDDIVIRYLGNAATDQLVMQLETMLLPIVDMLDIDSIYEMYYLDNYNIVLVNKGKVKELRYEYLLLGLKNHG